MMLDNTRKSTVINNCYAVEQAYIKNASYAAHQLHDICLVVKSGGKLVVNEGIVTMYTECTEKSRAICKHRCIMYMDKKQNG
jgi:hypothetical protein